MVYPFLFLMFMHLITAEQFDRNGVTGGCQAVYTVIPSSNSTVNSAPSCQNVSFPAGALDVVGIVDNGPMSQFGWVDQVNIQPSCTCSLGTHGFPS